MNKPVQASTDVQIEKSVLLMVVLVSAAVHPLQSNFVSAWPRRTQRLCWLFWPVDCMPAAAWAAQCLNFSLHPLFKGGAINIG